MTLITREDWQTSDGKAEVLTLALFVSDAEGFKNSFPDSYPGYTRYHICFPQTIRGKQVLNTSGLTFFKNPEHKGKIKANCIKIRNLDLNIFSFLVF